MGGSSRSRSSNTTTSRIDNSNVQATGEGVVLQTEGSNNRTTLINTDHEAVESSFEFGEDALDTVSDTVSNSLFTVDNTVDEAFEFGNNALDFGLDALQETNALGKFAINEAQELSQQALTVAGNAQQTALSKVKELSDAFKINTSQNTKQVLMVSGIALALLLLFMFIRTRGQK